MLSKISVTIILGTFYAYLLYPTITFPTPPSDSLQSAEQADTESYFRRSYFTNFSREEVITHYSEQFDYLPTLKLNHPPEDAQVLIRDQTRSRYLEELVHPFRESIYINGFIPTEAKDDISYKGERFFQKITIRYVPGNTYIAMASITAAVGLSAWIFYEIKTGLGSA